MKFNIKNMKDKKFVRSLIKFANLNFIAKTLIGILVWIGALIPIWMYIGVRFLIDPIGFWQEFAIFITFAIILGIPQFILIVLGGTLTFVLIFED
jgi:hypothetical protein